MSLAKIWQKTDSRILDERTMGRMTMKSTRRVLGHSLLRSLIRSLRTARLARALRCAHSCAHSFARSLTHSLRSSWESDLCLWIECVDFISFEPTVRCFFGTCSVGCFDSFLVFCCYDERCNERFPCEINNHTFFLGGSSRKSLLFLKSRLNQVLTSFNKTIFTLILSRLIKERGKVIYAC